MITLYKQLLLMEKFPTPPSCAERPRKVRVSFLYMFTYCVKRHLENEIHMDAIREWEETHKKVRCKKRDKSALDWYEDCKIVLGYQVGSSLKRTCTNIEWC